MPPRLTFYHTAVGNAAMLENLVAEIAPDVQVKHVFSPESLDEAAIAGSMSKDLEQRIVDKLLAEANAGTDMVVLTCSTIGAAANTAKTQSKIPIQRIDAAMAEAAVASGPRILVAACLQSTVGPTTNLLRSVAQEQGRQITIEVILLSDAWSILQAGNPEGYATAIAEGLRPVASKADVIVLAQASMAKAADLLKNLPIPVLSSPRLGVEAAIKQLRNSSR